MRPLCHRSFFLLSAALTQPVFAAELEQKPTQEEPSLLTVSLVSAGLTSVVLGAGTVAWWTDGLKPFSWRETGFFGRDTYAGGADKAGHFFSSYVSVHAAAAAYRGIGVPPELSAWYATLFTFLLWNGFELIDGFTEFGFEYGDVVMNSLGIGAGLLTNLYPRWDDTFSFRMGYVPSVDFLEHDKNFLKFLNDYSGMLFYFDVKGKGLAHWLELSPTYLKYFVAGGVFGADHYSPVKRFPLRRRMLGAHFGLSLPEILRAVGEGDHGVESIARFFDFFNVPLFNVALLKDLNESGQWYLNFGVANRAEVAL